jgi:hypothetical protein
VHVEPLAPGQPVHAYLLGAPWDETEALAWALPALGFRGLLGECAVMFREHVPAEAPGVGPDPEAVLLIRGGLPGDIDAPLHRLLGMLELPGQHLLGSRCHPELLDTLQDCLLVSSFNHLYYTTLTQ